MSIALLDGVLNVPLNECAPWFWACPTLGDPMDCSPPGSSVHGFSRQEYWGGLPGPPPGDLPNPGIEPASPALLVDSLPFSHESVYSLFLFYVTVLVFLFAAQS